MVEISEGTNEVAVFPFSMGRSSWAGPSVFDDLDRLLWPVPPQPEALTSVVRGSQVLPAPEPPELQCLEASSQNGEGSCLMKALP